MTGVQFAPFNKTAERNALKELGDGFVPLRKLTPGMGSYINEVSDLQHDQAGRSNLDSVGVAGREGLAKDILGQPLPAPARNQERDRPRRHTMVLSVCG